MEDGILNVKPGATFDFFSFLVYTLKVSSVILLPAFYAQVF